MATNSLEMAFLDGAGKTRVLKINNPIPNLHEDVLYQIMSEVVRLNLFTGKDGLPLYAKSYKATYVSSDEKIAYRNTNVKK
ncbi:DUF2922 domain-containing protein [Lactobacillaceae bacterium Scapto_B20]